MLVALSHDIRTPLNAMALTLTVLEMKLGDRLDAEDRGDLSSLRRDLERAGPAPCGPRPQQARGGADRPERDGVLARRGARHVRPGGPVAGDVQGDRGRPGPGDRRDGADGQGDGPAGGGQPALERHPVHVGRLDRGPQSHRRGRRHGRGRGHGDRHVAGRPGPRLRGVLPGGPDPP